MNLGKILKIFNIHEKNVLLHFCNKRKITSMQFKTLKYGIILSSTSSAKFLGRSNISKTVFIFILIFEKYYTYNKSFFQKLILALLSLR